ncbi:MAG TPA: LD-carboxypeptidase [Vicinamibacterales bacterium]|nr:LD-carboxypeptidase [Vicinamibacterales bacterium]
MNRRDFLYTAGLASVAAQVPLRAHSGTTTPPALIKPRRLTAGDTVGIVSPASATFNPVDVQIARDSLEALGLKVQMGAHMMDRHGYLGGDDKARAADVNAFFADRSVAAIHPIRGGWGSSRLLPYLDFDMIRRNPKILLGYSDISALLLAVHARTGLVTFHGPIALGRWDTFSVDYYKRILFDAEPVLMQNKRDLTPDRNSLTPIEYRTVTITPGKARGRLLGGNLTVLTTMMGSPYLPDWDGCIFFCEDVHEEPYRIDRMLTQLELAGVLRKIKGFIFGACTECTPGEGTYASLTLTEIFDDHIKPLGIPAWQGAMIGHQIPQWTIPEGIEAEVDAEAGTIKLLDTPVI